MKQRNATILRTIFATLLFSVAFAVPVYAQNLVVDFNPNPLFEQNNFLPEDTSEGTATVTNNSGETQTVLTESINGFDSDGLGDHLNLTIIDSDSTTYFDDTLGNFLTNGEVSLGTLDDEESETYTFTVSFTNIDDNDFQEKSLGFDVCVGFEGSELNCGDTVVGDEGDTGGGGGGSGGGGGGGSGGGIVYLEVFGEEVTEENIVTTTAVIEWDSNLLATSQVIYGKASLGPYTLNLTVDPYFGYPLGTVENPTKVTHHTVILTGLEVGVDYVYRVVSRASPPTVGFEQTFALGEDGSTPLPVPTGGEPLVATQDEASASTAVSDEPLDATQDEANALTVVSEETVVPESDNTQVAALGLLAFPDNLTDWLVCIGIFLLLVFLIFIAWILYMKMGDNDDTKETVAERKKLFFFVGSSIAIFIAYIFDWGCTIIPLAIFAVVYLALYLHSRFVDNK